MMRATYDKPHRCPKCGETVQSVPCFCAYAVHETQAQPTKKPETLATTGFPAWMGDTGLEPVSPDHVPRVGVYPVSEPTDRRHTVMRDHAVTRIVNEVRRPGGNDTATETKITRGRREWPDLWRAIDDLADSAFGKDSSHGQRKYGYSGESA